eukprot:8161404-Pyramimonas_sp.AAC.1
MPDHVQPVVETLRDTSLPPWNVELDMDAVPSPARHALQQCPVDAINHRNSKQRHYYTDGSMRPDAGEEGAWSSMQLYQDGEGNISFAGWRSGLWLQTRATPSLLTAPDILHHEMLAIC